MASFKKIEERHQGRLRTSPSTGCKRDSGRFEKSIDEDKKKLYVRNIPSIWTREDIADLFSEYGRLASVYQCPSTTTLTWGFVEFYSEQSAESAIDHLHGTRPYNLFVVFADGDKSPRVVNNDQHNSANVSRHYSLKHSVDNRDLVIGDLSKKLDLKMVVDNQNGTRQVTEDEFICHNLLGEVYPVAFISQELRYEIASALDKLLLENHGNSSVDGTGSCFTCGFCTINACTKCGVWYCSRECQVKDWPQHKFKCTLNMQSGSNDQSNHTKNFVGHDNIRDTNKHDIQKPKHDNDTVPKMKTTNDNRRYDQFQDSKRNMQKDQYHDNKNVTNRVKRFDKQKYEGDPSVTNRREFGRPSKFNEPIQNNTQDADDELWDANVKSTSTPSKDEARSFEEESIKVKATHSVEATQPLLPIGSFKNVTITHVIGEGHYCVQLNEMLAVLTDMENTLIRGFKDSAPLTLAEKSKCIVLLDGLCHRGFINSICPLKVTLVDYGTQKIVNADQIKSIPEEFKKYQKMAVKIKLVPGAKTEFYHKEIDDSFIVKAVSKDLDGSIFVEVEDTKQSPEKEINDPTRNDSNRPVHVEDSPTEKSSERIDNLTGNGSSSTLLSPNKFSEVTVTFVENDGDIWINPESLSTLTEICGKINEEVQQAASFTPILDAICLAAYSNEWYRGRITSISPLKVFFIDFGNEETCTNNDLRVCSSQLQALPPQAIKIRFAAGTPEKYLKTSVHATVKVKPVSEVNDVVIVEVEDVNYATSSQPILSPPKQDIKNSESTVSDEMILIEPKQKKDIKTDRFTMDQLPENKVKIGCEIKLTLLLILDTVKSLVLVDAESPEFKQVIKMTSSLMEYCDSCTEKSYAPIRNELCGVYYEPDGAWYRAVCLTPYTDKSSVMLIDLGNQCLIDHSNTRKLTKDFTNQAAAALVCIYEAIPDKCSKSLTDRLKELLKENESYDVTIKSELDTIYNIDIKSVTLLLQKEGLL